MNIHDRPLVIYEAPRFTYDDRQPAQERLLAIIDAFGTPSGQVLLPSDRVDDHGAAPRMDAYFEARDLFLRSGADIEPTGDVSEV